MENIENKTVELTKEELEKVAGGNDGLRTRKVANLITGYLAIRNYPSYDAANELGSLYNDDYVYSTERYNGDYVWVYAETRYDPYYGKNAYKGYGWVNSKFLA